MNEQIEQAILCPYCNASFTVLIDPSIEHQSYIEDCQVCCQPINFSVSVFNGELTNIDVTRDDE